MLSRINAGVDIRLHRLRIGGYWNLYLLSGLRSDSFLHRLRIGRHVYLYAADRCLCL